MATDAEQSRERRMAKRDLVAWHAIMREQQPAWDPFVDCMPGVARRCLRMRVHQRDATARWTGSPKHGREANKPLAADKPNLDRRFFARVGQNRDQAFFDEGYLLVYRPAP